MSLDPCSGCCCEFVSAVAADGSLPPVIEVNACLVEIQSPMMGRGFRVIDLGQTSVATYAHAAGQPPTGISLSASATLTLFEDVSATMTSYLEPVSRGSWYGEKVIKDTPSLSSLQENYIRSITGVPSQLAHIDGATRSLASYTSANLSELREFVRPGIEDETPMVDGLSYYTEFHVTQAANSVTVEPSLNGWFWRSNLQFGSSQMWVIVSASSSGLNPAGRGGVFHSYLTRLSSVFPEDDGGSDFVSGVFTALVYRPDFLMPINTAQQVPASIGLNPLGLTALPVPPDANINVFAGRDSRARAGYSNTAISSLLGEKVSLYRNGQAILSAVRPTPAAVQAAAPDDGSYFLVSDIDGTNDDPAYPNAISRPQNWHTTFSSVVIDRVRPSVGLVAVNDSYLNSFPFTFPATFSLTETVLSTKPMSFGGTAVDDAQVVVRPGVASVTHTRTSLSTYSATYSVVSHSANTICDYAGNDPDAVASYQYKRIAPENINSYRRSPSATLTQIDRLPIRQSEKVPSLTLTFSRPVAGSVLASQFRLYKDSAVFSGSVTVESIGSGSQAWKIILPDGLQTEGAFVLVEYDPGGQLVADDFPIYRFATYAALPSQGVLKARYVYIDDDGKERWLAVDVVDNKVVWKEIAPNGYGPDIYVPGKPDYLPEPCILAARSSWLMAVEAGSPRLIDSSSTFRFNIGGVASITQSRTVETSKASTAAQSNDLTLVSPPTLIYHQGSCVTAEKLNREAFTPCVPPPTDPPADCSFFGLPTTIHPCPPREISACAAPRVAQKHASAIRINGDCPSIDVWLSTASAATRQPIATPAEISAPIGLTFSENPFQLESGLAALRLLLLNQSRFTLGSSYNGKTLCQNVWMGKANAGGAAIQLRGSTALFGGGTIPDIVLRLPRALGNYIIDCGGQDYRTILDIHNEHTGFDATPTTGSSAGIRPDRIRALETGRLTAESVQVAASAHRKARVYSGLQTTTLSDLYMRVVFRVVMRYEQDWADYDAKWPPLGVDPAVADGPTNAPNGLPFGICNPGPLFYEEGSGYGVPGEPTQSDLGVFAWPGGFEKSSRTITHRFVAAISTESPLSKSQEDTLASGGVVSVYSSIGAPYFSVGSFLCMLNLQKSG